MSPYLYIFLVSMLPFIELRGAIPLGIYWGLPPLWVFLIAVIGNMVPVPFFLLFLESIEKYVRRIPRLASLLDWIFERTYRKADEKVRRWEYLALIFFVAIPLPGTGAWTGSLIAYLFKFKVSKAFGSILLGVLIAGILVLAFSLGAFAGV